MDVTKQEVEICIVSRQKVRWRQLIDCGHPGREDQLVLQHLGSSWNRSSHKKIKLKKQLPNRSTAFTTTDGSAAVLSCLTSLSPP